ncbi:MAG TPA: nitrilase-related carbon-nitrogen hydrolase [Spirochaetota bacterium]
MCYFFSTGLQGDYWFLLWVAPIPILLYGYCNSKKSTFIVATIIIFLSKMNILAYFSDFLSPVIAIIYIFVISVIYSGIIVLNKIISSKMKEPAAIFVFPVLFTAFEFLVSLILPNGTFGSIAYTQTNSVFNIQIASITGMYGITFFLCLFSSCVTFLILIKTRKPPLHAFILPLLILVFVPVFGIVRTGIAPKDNTVSFKVACVKVDSLSDNANLNSPKNRDLVLQEYLNQISRHVNGKVDCIVLPEKMMELMPEERSVYYPRLSSVASEKNSLLVAGLKIKGTRNENIAAVFFPDGKSVSEYHKRYMVPGWEDTYARGNSLLHFRYKEMNVGVVICKDMDFPDWIRKYSSIDIMLVPAWDFKTDNWLHSRMAILRGVENGFTVIRSAKEGNLTISDSYGKIITEVVYNKADKENVMISGFIPYKSHTMYSKFGNWFCWLNLIFLGISILYSVRINVVNRK